MRLNCSIFDDTVVFDQYTDFSKEFSSPGGALFTATTLQGEQILTIVPKRVGSLKARAKLAAIEHVASLPIADMLWNVEMNPSGDVTFISIGGEKPKGIIETPQKAISIDGEKPEGIVDLPQVAISGAGERPDETDMSKIKLISDFGSWRIEPDSSGQFLNVSFKTL